MEKLGATRTCVAVIGTVTAGALMAIGALVGSTANSDPRIFAAERTGSVADVSANWAGYVASSPDTTYTSVTATWREPAVDCDQSGAGSASAFWVGLGGYNSSSEALEQTGTSADCDPETGEPTYYAWYELVPDASVTVKSLKVAPGDLITTSVNVVATDTVLVQVKNRTRKSSFTKKLTFKSPDLTSAEWIAEAPSSCDSLRCRTLPLSDFGSVEFTRVAAIGNDVGGTLSVNPGWTTTAITLVADRGRGFFPGPQRFAGSSSSTAGASPAAADAQGRSFTVQWSSDESASQ